MQFSGSDYLVPILIIAVASVVIGWQLWVRSRKRHYAEAGLGEVAESELAETTEASESAEPVEADSPAQLDRRELIAWHRVYEQAIYDWLWSTDRLLAAAMAEQGAAGTEEISDEYQQAGQLFLEAAAEHPLGDQQAELRQIYECAEVLLARLGFEIGDDSDGGDVSDDDSEGDLDDSGEAVELSSDDLADSYMSLRDIWAGRLRQLAVDDNFALKVLSLQGRE